MKMSIKSRRRALPTVALAMIFSLFLNLIAVQADEEFDLPFFVQILGEEQECGFGEMPATWAPSIFAVDEFLLPGDTGSITVDLNWFDGTDDCGLLQPPPGIISSDLTFTAGTPIVVNPVGCATTPFCLASTVDTLYGTFTVDNNATPNGVYTGNFQVTWTLQ
jgi:hypothetical protein